MIQECISQSHSIVLSRDRKNNNSINTVAIFLQIFSSVIISLIIFIFANKLTYIYTLENDARNILTGLIKLKAIQLPILAISYIPKNDLKVKGKTNLVLIATVVSSLFNIFGDIMSIKLGFNEVGIYVATIIATLINTILLFIFSKYKYRKIKMIYIKDIINHAKDYYLIKRFRNLPIFFLKVYLVLLVLMFML